MQHHSPPQREALPRDTSPVNSLMRDTPSPPASLGDSPLSTPRTSLLSDAAAFAVPARRRSLEDATGFVPIGLPAPSGDQDAGPLPEALSGPPVSVRRRSVDGTAGMARGPGQEQESAALQAAQQPPAPQAQEEERSYVFETRVEAATALWGKGREEFAQGQVDAARASFQRGLHHVDFDELSYNFELLDVHREQVVKVKVPLLLNLALCALKTGAPALAAEKCSEAIVLAPDNVKAHFRRGQAHVALGRNEAAKTDFVKAQSLAPRSAEVRDALDELRKRMKQTEAEFGASWAKEGAFLAPVRPAAAADRAAAAPLWPLWTLLLALLQRLWALVTGRGPRE
jgi:tetratricopeptide (TPR) repeat protein